MVDRGDSGFRQPAKAHSPALASLAERAGDRRRELPQDARALSPRDLHGRLVGATRDRRLARVGEVLLVASFLIPGAGLTLLLIGLAGAGMAALLASLPLLLAPLPAWRVYGRRVRRAVDAELAWPARLPFPVEGYDLWLASERPVLDLALRAPIDPALLSDGIAGFDPAIAVSQLDDRTVRLEAPARPRDEYPAAFRALADEVLVPLHRDVGIEKLSMGGTMRPS